MATSGDRCLQVVEKWPKIAKVVTFGHTCKWLQSCGYKYLQVS